MLSSNLSLSSSSPDLARRLHYHHPYPHPASFQPLPFSHHRALSRPHSRAHHHHHHHPSWSSSVSSYSPNRTSNFLIDEYGNEHDPEHCQFKTVPQSDPRHSSESSSSTTSRRTSLASSCSSRASCAIRRPGSVLGAFGSPPSYATVPMQSTPAPMKKRRRPCPAREDDEFKWARSIWAHLRPNHQPASAGSPSSCTKKTKSEDAEISRFDIHRSPLTHSPARNGSTHLRGVRRKIEVVKLEVRFGILRTRKRVMGVWKRL